VYGRTEQVDNVEEHWITAVVAFATPEMLSCGWSESVFQLSICHVTNCVDVDFYYQYLFEISFSSVSNAVMHIG
jgi:hypothetical protein